jgi:hypothetical protein
VSSSGDDSALRDPPSLTQGLLNFTESQQFFTATSFGSLQSPDLFAQGDLLTGAMSDNYDEAVFSEPTVEASLQVVPPIPCTKRQPTPLVVAKWLLAVSTVLAVACLAMQIAQEFA